MREAGEQKNKPKCAGQWIGFLTLPIRTRSERTFTRSSRRIQRFFSKNKPWVWRPGCSPCLGADHCVLARAAWV